MKVLELRNLLTRLLTPSIRARDVLRRHYKTCPRRGLAPIPTPLKKGKRRRACDGCVVSKLSCDSEQPCESCLSRGKLCTYVKLLEESPEVVRQDRVSISDLSTGDFDQHVSSALTQSCADLTSASAPDLKERAPQQPKKSSISFLLNYANPETKSLTDTFGYSQTPNPEHFGTPGPLSVLFAPGLPVYPDLETFTNLLYGEFPTPSQGSSFNSYKDQSFLLPDTSLDELLPGYFFPIYDTSPVQPQYQLSAPLNDQIWHQDSIFDFPGIDYGPSEALITDLTEFCRSLEINQPGCVRNVNLKQVLTLLEPSRVQRLIELYFHHWHRHSPIIHCGTFNIRKVSLHLLLAIILTGALFSSSQDDVNMAKGSLDIAEEYAFRNPTFMNLVSGNISDESLGNGASFEALQAAFSIAQLQLREGSLIKRKYARSVHFGNIILVCVESHTWTDT